MARSARFSLCTYGGTNWNAISSVVMAVSISWEASLSSTQVLGLTPAVMLQIKYLVVPNPSLLWPILYFFNANPWILLESK